MRLPVGSYMGFPVVVDTDAEPFEIAFEDSSTGREIGRFRLVTDQMEFGRHLSRKAATILKPRNRGRAKLLD